MYQSCINRFGGSSRVADGNCSVEVSDQAKLEITYLYKRLHAQLSKENPQLLPKLESSQKSWIKYRDEHCKLESSQTTASGETWKCDMRLNVDRARELRVFF
ncbi:lysozyme inhibitor LprI family protein [Lysobacter sp. CA199]|uniref:lysozyme inhibitor LprI family protein n=1 Tax=Lysobacter sp. CA199 TaxID=3455608 RepID=UPI003F8D5D2D